MYYYLTLEKKIFAYGKNWHMLHISRHFSTLNSWYLHLLIYYKYMLNFQWGLFCKLGFGVTLFKLFHIKFDMNFLFTCTIGCVIYHLMCWCRPWANLGVHQLIFRSIKSTIIKLVESLKLRTQVVAICHHIDHWLSHIQAPIMIVLCWMWL